MTHHHSHSNATAFSPYLDVDIPSQALTNVLDIVHSINFGFSTMVYALLLYLIITASPRKIQSVADRLILQPIAAAMGAFRGYGGVNSVYLPF